MKEYRYPTAFNSWGNAEERAIKRVLQSGRFTQGPEVEAFEAEVAAYHRRKHAIMVNRNQGAGTRILIDQLLAGARPGRRRSR